MSQSESLPLEVTVRDVHAMRQAEEDFLLLDCREHSEFETARIEGSLLIPMGQIAERVGELEPHRQRRIVVHCHHGGRSLRVTQWLREQGFGQAQNMAGGIDHWSEVIDPSLRRY